MHRTARLLVAMIAVSSVACAAKPPAKNGGFMSLDAVNRSVTFENDAIHLDARDRDGVAWTENETFAEGTLTLEVRGLDQPQKSFVGIAFHGDGENFDVVYVRPFNFNSADAVRRAHALQYASEPDYPWSVLREKFPGKYEAAIAPPPAAEQWVKLRLEIQGKHLRVFVNDAAAPTLEVDLLNPRLKGRVGFWVGDDSEGWFRGLKVEPHKSAEGQRPAAPATANPAVSH